MWWNFSYWRRFKSFYQLAEWKSLPHVNISTGWKDCVDTQRIVCSRRIELRPSETAITISTSHPFRCFWLAQEKYQRHRYQRESIDSACNFVCSNLNYCLKHSSPGPLSQPTVLIKPTTTACAQFFHSASRYSCYFASGALALASWSLVRRHWSLERPLIPSSHLNAGKLWLIRLTLPSIFHSPALIALAN